MKSKDTNIILNNKQQQIVLLFIISKSVALYSKRNKLHAEIFWVFQRGK